MAMDTSGDSLHKRGYRTLTSKAPITETLAAALLMLTPWKPDRILVDPFCGSRTFPIEAAMMAANMAPGMNREFLAEEWKNLIPKKCWYEAMDEANDLVKDDISVDIQGYDIDGEIVRRPGPMAAAAGSGPSDPFPAEAGEPAEPSEEIRLPYYKPALRGTDRG